MAAEVAAWIWASRISKAIQSALKAAIRIKGRMECVVSPPARLPCQRVQSQGSSMYPLMTRMPSWKLLLSSLCRLPSKQIKWLFSFIMEAFLPRSAVASLIMEFFLLAMALRMERIIGR